MKKVFTLNLLLLLPVIHLIAQQELKPLGGGEYVIEKSDCVPPSERQRIQTMLQQNIQQLKAENILPQDWGEPRLGAKPSAGNFIWPLQQQSGFNYNSYYGISNYVDLDPMFPNYLLDWNCGTRTYDLSNGYNHGGIDIFLWPFSQTMQENGQVGIVSVTDGIIIGKEDGNFDKNCVMGNGNWNAVYIGNSDGTICWYGHMKSNSLTPKGIGLSVTAGEFLGLVGSSGSSTGPHLHFETHAASSEILEPYEGTCNPNASLWANQKPYIEPTINTLLTHSAPPDFPPCPQLETLNDKDTFTLGATAVFAAYYHDQTNTNPSVYTILKPDNSIFQTWNHTSNAAYYTASYWYWTRTLSNDSADVGEWTFRAAYEGNTVNHKFYLSAGSASNNIGNVSSVSETIKVFPNPSNGKFLLAFENRSLLPATYRITDITGRLILSGDITLPEEDLDFSDRLSPGIYFLKVLSEAGGNMNKKIVVR